jgi:hypothetical protein
MGKHVSEWLGAYHDGELHGSRLRQVEAHLAGCATCQAELDEIRNLSSLLHSHEPAEDFLPTERFVANLALQLPRQAEQHPAHSALKTIWWLAPIGLLGIWLCVDITNTLSAFLTLAVDSGLFNGNLAWLGGNPIQMGWFTTTQNLFSNQLGGLGVEILASLNDAHLFLVQLAGNLIPYLILAIGYLGWLVAWWLRQQGQPSQNAIEKLNHKVEV